MPWIPKTTIGLDFGISINLYQIHTFFFVPETTTKSDRRQGKYIRQKCILAILQIPPHCSSFHLIIWAQWFTVRRLHRDTIIFTQKNPWPQRSVLHHRNQFGGVPQQAQAPAHTNRPRHLTRHQIPLPQTGHCQPGLPET